MLTSLFLVLLLALLCDATNPGQNEFHIQRPEGTRKYYVWIPKNFTQTVPATVVFAFHGLNDKCTDFADKTSFKALSEAHGFLFVYPCGSNGILGVAWNAGTCCLRGSKIDDVEFTRQMITQLQTNFHVNKSRIFVSGFSNGAMMSEILACEAAPLFVAHAAVSGVVELEPGMSGGLQKCSEAYAKLNKSANILKIHGNADPVVPWTGDAVLGFPTVPDDFQAWSQRNKCQGQPVQTYKNGPYSNQVYQHCNANSLLELMKHDGGGHVWPKDKYFQAQEYIWKWFTQFL